MGQPASHAPANGEGGGELSPTAELSAALGRNLRRLRIRQGHSLERFAKLSGVSRAMLGQIETGKSTPTIGVLWKVATALGVPFATLMQSQERRGTVVLPRQDAKILVSSGGAFASRALFPFDGERRVEFYELRVASGHEESANAHAPGTVENIVVARGAIEIATDGGRPVLLREGDAIQFEADVPHAYRNAGDVEAVLYLVMTYVETVIVQ